MEVGFDTVIGGLSGYAGGKGAHCRKVSYSSLKNGFVKSSYLQPKGFVKRMAWDRLSRSLKTSFKIGSAYKAAKNTFRWVKKGFKAAKRALGW